MGAPESNGRPPHVLRLRGSVPRGTLRARHGCRHVHVFREPNLCVRRASFWKQGAAPVVICGQQYEWTQILHCDPLRGATSSKASALRSLGACHPTRLPQWSWCWPLGASGSTSRQQRVRGDLRAQDLCSDQHSAVRCDEHDELSHYALPACSHQEAEAHGSILSSGIISEQDLQAPLPAAAGS